MSLLDIAGRIFLLALVGLAFLIFRLIEYLYEGRNRADVKQWPKRKKPSVQAIAAYWRRAGVDLAFGPVAVVYYKDEFWPTGTQGKPSFLSITAHEMVFNHQDFDRVTFPLACFRFASVKNNILILYMENSGWYILRLTFPEAAAVANKLRHIAQVTQIPYIDEAPVSAQQMTQNIYGYWETEGGVTLYLMWPGLLVNRQQVIPHESIQALIHNKTSLRIELKRNEEGQTLGFEVPYHEKWSNLLAELAHIPVDEEIGRKKKS
jgi:hypothetical protein